nr:Chain A, Protein FAF1 [Saccharomyces cerevisiae S288C]4QMF_C Chain C, Protein FAF1 [Saccharomyces cerevisiae S288C]
PEAENLQNDLELQQFLRESHLLSAFNDDQVIGKARSRTLEMRLNRLSR